MAPSLPARCLGEFLGTGVLVAVGTGAIVQASRAGGTPQWLMAAAWFLAVLVPVILFARLSGAHLNPVVSLALAGSGRAPWGIVPAYWAAQFAGAFAGSAFVLAIVGGGSHLGSTVPTSGDWLRTFASEFGFTALLVLTVFVLCDRGEGTRRWRLTLPALAVGLATYVIGPWTGSSLNPARSLAPAVLSGTYTELWLYFVAVTSASLLMAAVWRRRAPHATSDAPGPEVFGS